MTYIAIQVALSGITAAPAPVHTGDTNNGVYSLLSFWEDAQFVHRKTSLKWKPKAYKNLPPVNKCLLIHHRHLQSKTCIIWKKKNATFAPAHFLNSLHTPKSKKLEEQRENGRHPPSYQKTALFIRKQLPELHATNPKSGFIRAVSGVQASSPA